VNDMHVAKVLGYGSTCMVWEGR